MDQNPAAAASLTLSAAEQAALRRAFPAAATSIETSGEWTGVLETTVEDDFDRGSSRTRSWLRTAGQAWELHWQAPPSFSSGPNVRVAGVALDGRILARTATTLDASQVRDASPACSVTGQQRTLVLLVDFPSAQLPANATKSFVSDGFFGSGRSVSTMWQEYSYGRTTASGDVIGPLRLDADYACERYDQILAAAIRATDAQVNLTSYSRIFIVMPSTGTCTWAGLGYVGCGRPVSPSRGGWNASVSFLRITSSWTSDELARVGTHEGGHNFGLSHARSVDYGAQTLGPPGVDGVHNEYGDLFSNMGRGAGHWTAPHKNMLGWFLAPANVQQVEQPGTFLLQPIESVTASAQVLRVRRGSEANRWVWVEYRQPVGLDADIPAAAFGGATIHYEDPGNPGVPLQSELLDLTPSGTPNVFLDAQLQSGRAWSDPHSTLSILAGAGAANGLKVTVAYDTPCATLSPQGRTHGPEVETGVISVSGDPSCVWQAATTSDWVVLTGAPSGAGNGGVSYSLRPNPTNLERVATVFVARQTYTITQAPRPQALSVAPSTGSGASQTFSASFRDSFDYHQLPWAEVNINSSAGTTGACYLRYDAATGGISLRNDGDTAWLGPVTPAASGVLQNSQCLLSAAGTSVNGAGARLTLNLALSFKPAFQGARNTYLQAGSNGAGVGWQLLGTWTVNAAPAILPVTPDSGSGPEQLFSVAVSAPAGYATLTGMHVNFAATGSARTNTCLLAMAPSGSGMWASLQNDSGTGWTGVQLGGTGRIENSQCTLNAAGSSANGAGNEWTVNLSVAFKPAYAGARKIWVQAAAIGFWTDWQWRGTWTVASAASADTISGRVTTGGAGLAGVTVILEGTLEGGAAGVQTTDGSGSYSFSGLPAGPGSIVTPKLAGYAFLPASRTVSPLTADPSADFTAIGVTDTLSLDRGRLNFAAGTTTQMTPPQVVLVSYSGAGAPTWSATVDQPWLQVSPATGSAPTRMTVSVAPAFLPPTGVSTGTVTVSVPGAPAKTLDVTLTRLTAPSPPFGSFDTPTDNAAGVAGSVAVTGWALDDIMVSKVEIHRDPAGAEPTGGNGLVYVGDAVFVPNARPDVESLDADVPLAYRAGWGYLLLTTDLPTANGPPGNGTVRLWALATDVEGNTVNLGSKTITLGNAGSMKPFGAIDTPEQGGPASGASFVSHGWALTPLPGIISTQPANVWVSVDGAYIGRVNYGQFRPDIAAGFPLFLNAGSEVTGGAGGHFILDTTQYSNGMHNIGWYVVDESGNQAGVGSRFFLVENGVSGAATSVAPALLADRPDAALAPPDGVRPQPGAAQQVSAQELERLVIPLPDGSWTGWQVAQGELLPLPVGSTVDNAAGALYWQLGPGFLGRYELLFTNADGGAHAVTVDVDPMVFQTEQ